MRQLIRTLSAIGACAMLAISPWAAVADEADTQKNLKQAAVATGVLSKMGHATQLAGLDDPNIDVGPLTLLAPSDAAFDALPADFRERLLAPENKQHLTDLLLFHAISGLYSTDRLLKAQARIYTIPGIAGDDIMVRKVRRDGIGSIDLEGAKITQADIVASDGIIHIIDKVLIPPHVMDALSRPPSDAAVADAETLLTIEGEGDQ
jgi:uncharacterized surface protein with fasciclin (FAS1) repeats